jgi:hypothetical protein
VGNGKYLTSELVYEKEHERFRCPAGNYLTPNPAVCANHKRYVSSSEDCRDCPLASTCEAAHEYVAPTVGEEQSRPSLFRGSAGVDARNDVPRTSVRPDVEVRGAVRRGEAESLSCASEVPRTGQSADPGLPQRDRAEPQTPALPTLLLAVSAPLVLFDPHCACIAIKLFTPTNQLPN